MIKKVPLLAIDFNKSWWSVLSSQKKSIIFIALGETISNTFLTLLPMMLGIIFTQKHVTYLNYLFVGWFIVYCLQYLTRKESARLQLLFIHSTHARAHEWFLQVDPIYHARRSSGTVLGKIDRAARGYENLIDAFTYDFLSIGIGFITAIIPLFSIIII